MTEIDTSVPHSARIWNYWLGGKDNYLVDQEAGDAYTAVFRGIVTIARSSRAFLGRSIRHLVEEAGVRQFLDVGTGLLRGAGAGRAGSGPGSPVASRGRCGPAADRAARRPGPQAVTH